MPATSTRPALSCTPATPLLLYAAATANVGMERLRALFVSLHSLLFCVINVLDMETVE